MKIAIANNAEVDQIWPTIGPLFSKVSERCGDDLESGELWQMCRSGQAFLVVVFDDTGLAVATIAQFQRWTNGIVLRVLSMVGSGLTEWAEPLKNYLNDMGKTGGASRIVAEGREGWVRIFAEPKKLRSTYIMEIA